ncbi:MAG: hypothetical protein GY756_19685 [bacterium]|nr:hypothetical protein [bacterium]
MIKALSLILLILIQFSFGCKNKNEPKSSNTKHFHFEEKHIDNLIIEGKDIWVRNIPVKGELVMKLYEGDKCIILDTSDIDTIKGFVDYWYKITFQGDTGWVFGSQTNIKTVISRQLELFLKRVKDFVYALAEMDIETLNSFIYPEESVHYRVPGASVLPYVGEMKDFNQIKGRGYFTGFEAPSSDKFKISGTYNKNNVFAYYRLKEFHGFTSLWRSLNDYQNIEITSEQEAYLNKLYEKEKQVTIVFKYDIEHVLELECYFYFKRGKWYLFGFFSSDYST